MERGNIAEFIKDLRIERSWSQDLLAQNAGVSKRTIQRLEKEGQCSHETLLAVAGAFDIDVRELTRFSAPSRVAVQDYPSMQTNEIEFSMPGSLIKWANKFPMVNKRFYKNMATTGLALMVIPLLFIVVNLLKYSFGFSSLLNPFDLLKSIPFLHQIITSPVFLVGSLVIALGLNAIPLVNLNVKKEEEELTGSFSIKGNRWNAMIVGASLFFMTFMMGYAAVENISEQATLPSDQVVQGSFLPGEFGETTPEQAVREELNELARIAEANYEEAMAQRAETDALGALTRQVEARYEQARIMEARLDARAQARAQVDEARALSEALAKQMEQQIRQVDALNAEKGTQELVQVLKSNFATYSNVLNTSLVTLNREIRILNDINSNKTDAVSYANNLQSLEVLLTEQFNEDTAVLQTLTFFEEMIVGDYQGALAVNGEDIVMTEDNGLSKAVPRSEELGRSFVILQHQLKESAIQTRELLEWVGKGDITGLEPNYLLKKLEAIKNLKESNLAYLNEMIKIVS